jgi:hypothetical protein
MHSRKKEIATVEIGSERRWCKPKDLGHGGLGPIIVILERE